MEAGLAALLIGVPPCHKAQSSPAQWDAEFESLFVKHPMIANPNQIFNHSVLEERMNTQSNHASAASRVEDYLDLKRSLCELQPFVSLGAAYFLAHTDLEKKWRQGSVAFREKHALIAIAGACAIATNLNWARLSCARELRVSYLSSNPQIYFDLLNAIAPSSLSDKLIEPLYISDPKWDRFQADHRDDTDEIEKYAVGYMLILRTKLITYVLQFLTHSVLEMPLPEVTVYKDNHRQTKTKTKKKEIPAFQKLQIDAMIRAFGKDAFSETSAEYAKAYKERKANKVSGCYHCHKTEKSREAFKRCAVCAKIGREVLYCSKECQVANWKAEHKKICGKTLDFDTASKLSHTVPQTAPTSDFPPPAPSFKRPLQLLAQIQWLTQHPEFDYALNRSIFKNNEDTALMSYLPPIKARFRAHRDRAIHSGNRMSVALMCECILIHLVENNSQDIKKESVVNQLSKEYGWSEDGLLMALAVLERVREDRPGRRMALVYGDCM